MKEFRHQLKKARKIRNMTQKELEKLAGVPVGSVSHWESGKRTPRLNHLVRLSDALWVTVDFLVGRDGGEPDADLR